MRRFIDHCELDGIHYFLRRNIKIPAEGVKLKKAAWTPSNVRFLLKSLHFLRIRLIITLSLKLRLITVAVIRVASGETLHATVATIL